MGSACSVELSRWLDAPWLDSIWLTSLLSLPLLLITFRGKDRDCVGNGGGNGGGGGNKPETITESGRRTDGAEEGRTCELLE